MTDDELEHQATPHPLRTLLGGLAVIVALGAIVATSLITRDSGADQQTFCTLEGLLGPAVKSADFGMVIVVDADEQEDILNGCPHGWGDVSLTPDCRLWEGSSQVGSLDFTRCAQLRAEAR